MQEEIYGYSWRHCKKKKNKGLTIEVTWCMGWHGEVIDGPKSCL